MLITLREQEYRPVLDEWVGDSDFASFVSILGETLLRGDHVLNAAPRLLRRLSQWNDLSGNQRAALEAAARSVIERPVAVAEVTDSLVITGPAGPTPDPVDPARPIRWHRRDWTWRCPKWRQRSPAPPPSCILVHSIGKPLRRILEAIEQERREPEASRPYSSTAAWLASMLPADDPSVLRPARLVWSWGLCSRPPIRGAPPASG